MDYGIVTASSRRPSLAEFMAAGLPDGHALAWLEGLLTVLGAVRQGRKWQCPSHGLRGEHSVSLSLKADESGRVLMFCHAGCAWTDVLRALYLTGDALRNAPPATPQQHAAAFLPGVRFPPPKSGGGGSLADRGYRFEAAHPYGEPEPFAWKHRHRHPSGAKEITWESLNPKGERVPGLLGRKETELGMYQARQVRMAMAMDEVIVLCESESSVDAMTKAGVYATCWPGGAGTAPTEQMTALFNGYGRVVLIPDYDDAGLDVAERICKVLPVRVVLGDPGEDARDLLKRLGSTEFRALVEGAEP
jgi:hypothetical protein